MIKKVTAVEFMEQEMCARRGSKLDLFEADILLLKQNGYTQEQILKFLKQNGIDVGKTTLNWFIKTRCNTGKQVKSVVNYDVNNSAWCKEPVSLQQKKNTEKTLEQVVDGIEPIEADSSPVTRPHAGKFNWQAEVKDSDIF